MIGREGPGPERPGPDYPPEWDEEREEEYERLAILGGYGLPAARAQEAAREPSCRSPYGCLAPGEGCPGRCPITDEEARQMEAVHDPCCSSHGVPMDCARYRRTHFVEVRPCCAADREALAEEHRAATSAAAYSASGGQYGSPDPWTDPDAAAAADPPPF